MHNKDLIKTNFQKSLETYDSAAVVQKKMAQKLLKLVLEHGRRNFQNILEIGSYTGLLTRPAVKNLDFESYLALDLVDSFDCIKSLSSRIKFQNCDIETFKTNQKFDLIISNAALQWCSDFCSTLKKLASYLNSGGILAVSAFGSGNLVEIRKTFYLGLEYPARGDILRVLPAASIEEEIVPLRFSEPLSLLRHLKSTGVNSLNANAKGEKVRITKQHLKILNDRFENTLTYMPIYIVFEK